MVQRNVIFQLRGVEARPSAFSLLQLPTPQNPGSTSALNSPCHRIAEIAGDVVENLLSMLCASAASTPERRIHPEMPQIRGTYPVNEAFLAT